MSQFDTPPALERAFDSQQMAWRREGEAKPGNGGSRYSSMNLVDEVQAVKMPTRRGHVGTLRRGVINVLCADGVVAARTTVQPRF